MIRCDLCGNEDRRGKIATYHVTLAEPDDEGADPVAQVEVQLCDAACAVEVGRRLQRLVAEMSRAARPGATKAD